MGKRAGETRTAKIGFSVEINLRFEATLAMALTIYAEAGAAWEIMGGADATACAVAGTSDTPVYKCQQLQTGLTPYVEYSGSQVAVPEAPSQGALVYAAVGLWLYAPYPQITFKVGWDAFGMQALVDGCVGCSTTSAVGTMTFCPSGISWASDFGSSPADGEPGETHPHSSSYLVQKSIAVSAAKTWNPSTDPAPETSMGVRDVRCREGWTKVGWLCYSQRTSGQTGCSATDCDEVAQGCLNQGARLPSKEELEAHELAVAYGGSQYGVTAELKVGVPGCEPGMELYGETAQRVHWLTVPNGGTGCHP